MMPLIAVLDLEVLEGMNAAVMADTVSNDNPINEYFSISIIFDSFFQGTDWAVFFTCKIIL